MSWAEWISGSAVEPSIYAADLARLGADVASVLQRGARVLHVDVGDGHFVEPIMIGPAVVASIRAPVHAAGGKLDCHLMVERPEEQIRQLARAGADSVTFHLEATDDPVRTAGVARELGLGVGLAFVPGTPVEAAAEAAACAHVDLALCMTIEPGYAGQTLLEDSFERVRRLRTLLPDEIFIQVDGGVSAANLAPLRAAGVALFVAGSAIFTEADPGRAYVELAGAAAGGSTRPQPV
jgi:ribulose-phosphate 3-epimerase